MLGILQMRYFWVAWRLHAVANFLEPPHAKSGMMGDILMYASYQPLLPHTRSAQARVHPLSTSGNTELDCAHCALSTLPTY